jgi:uncharacterized protein
MDRPFSLLVKPACADCNLRCEYCFYLEKCHLYPNEKRHRMSGEVLDQLIRTYMATDQPVYSIGWQGGEPTLMGVEFFRQVTALQQKYGRAGVSVANGLQTNATLIDDALAEHFARYNFLLGCSLDGPAALHDRYRHTIAGAPSHADVLRGIETLKRWRVEFNILVLVSQANVHHAREVYRYLVDQGFLFHQYIPCVEFDGAGARLPFAITGDEWGEFLCGIFAEWYPADIRRVSIRHVDSILNKLVDGQLTVCTMGTNCTQYLVVEYNGDIYPCDFFVQPDLRLGNIMQTAWTEALDSPLYHRFGAQKSDWHAQCAQCPFLDLCAGECLKHRMYAGNPARNLSWLCAGWRQFFQHTKPRLLEMAQTIRDERAEQERIAAGLRVQPYAGQERNAPCPCGSGKKYKKCCGR